MQVCNSYGNFNNSPYFSGKTEVLVNALKKLSPIARSKDVADEASKDFGDVITTREVRTHRGRRSSLDSVTGERDSSKSRSRSPQRLPDPRKTSYFRNIWGAEALHDAYKKVVQLYPGKPIPACLDGEFRAKEAVSYRCVGIEDKLKSGILPKDVLPIVTEWAPIHRRDLHGDDIASHSIEYTQQDAEDLKNLTTLSGTDSSLTRSAAKRALFQLTSKASPKKALLQILVEAGLPLLSLGFRRHRVRSFCR